MKKVNILILLLVTLITIQPLWGQNYILTTTALKDATWLRVNESEQIHYFTQTGGSKFVLVESNLQYSVTSSESWCKVEIATQADEKGVKITVDETTRFESASATITLKGKDALSATITVVQTGSEPSIVVKETNITILDDKYDFSLEIITNQKITIDHPTWITALDTETVIGGKHYLFRATEYLNQQESRKGNITVKAVSGTASDVIIPIEQIFRGYPRFAVLSDIHFGNSKGEGPMVKVPKALKNLVDKNLDAIFIAGDLTESGTEAQWKQYEQIIANSEIIPANLPVYTLMGNHDHYSGTLETRENLYKQYTKQPLHQYFEIKGYPFITLSMNGTSWSSYSDECILFLKESLEDVTLKYPGKPIFVMTHVPPKGTVYGSNTNDGNWGTDKYENVLKNFPQVIIFSGHSHYPLGDPRSIHQNIYTSINDGSTTYSEIENNLVNKGIHPENYEYVTEGVVVYLDRDKNVTLERWDTYRNEEINPKWYVNAPHDGTSFLYKDRKNTIAPVFAGSAKPTISEITESTCKVTFPQATETEDDVVHHYIIEIMDGTTTLVTFKKFSEYYLNSAKPLQFTISISGLPSGKTLKAQVKAVDAYFNESLSIISDEFSTMGIAVEYILPMNFPTEKIVGQWVFNSSGISQISANEGTSLTIKNTGGVLYVKENGVHTAFVKNSDVNTSTTNYLTLAHNLPATVSGNTDVKDYCIVMDVKVPLTTPYLPLLWSHSTAGDADVFVRASGAMGLSGGGLSYTADNFVLPGWNRIIINANLSEMKLDFYCMSSDGTIKESKKTVSSTARFSLRTDSVSDIFRDNGNEDGDAYIAQFVLLKTPLTQTELGKILTPYEITK